MTQVRPTLLIVEDNELNRDILNEILKDEYKTYLAENGAEGLRLLRQHSAEIDLVLLDIEMPVMNGYDVLKAVRFDPELKDIPIIIITAIRTAMIFFMIRPPSGQTPCMILWKLPHP